jgi:RimJ/RimL family protein N-acetyltransferase
MLCTDGRGCLDARGGGELEAARTLEPANVNARMKNKKAAKRRGMSVHSTPRRRLPATWLVGQKVRLRPIEPEDTPLLQRWLNEFKARDWLNGLFPRSRPQEAAWAAQVSTDLNRPTFIIQTKRGADIGLISLKVSDARAELGISINDDRLWSRGYGEDALRVLVAAAFRVLPLRRIQLFVLPDNLRAIRCYEKAGFAQEGVLRKYFRHQGAARDVIIMSTLHEEWISDGT